MAATPRYALYVAPRPETALAQFGARWLGWDLDRGQVVDTPETAGLSSALHEAVTAEPRRYGFHATLKAPFRLAEGATEGDLIGAAASFAAERAPLTAAPLRFGPLAGFLVFTPGEWLPRLHDLAADCVTALDGFRAPLTEAELAKRRRAGLSAAQETLLARWGYPYVMGEFRFHMTLTGSLESEIRAQVGDALQPKVRALLGEPLIVDDLALCVEPAPTAGFRVLRRFPLGRHG
jgi:putative phosphonate metabolism protein